MFRKKNKTNAVIKPMPRSQFLRLMHDFKMIGGKYICSKESDEYLQKRNAEASAVDGYTIILKRRPTRGAVYEELFHAKQFRDGKIDGSQQNRIECEIEAQKYLLDNAERLGLLKAEIERTQSALKEYEEILLRMKGEIP